MMQVPQTVRMETMVRAVLENRASGLQRLNQCPCCPFSQQKDPYLIIL